MINDWKREYELLLQFIAEDPRIVIRTSEVSIPQERRGEFYQRFDNVRSAVVEANLSELPIDADELSRRYMQMEQEVIRILGIERIVMPVDLSSFLHEPREGLARVLYTPLFDLVQGKTTVEAFEERAVQDLKSSAAELFRLGYEWWAGLAMIKLLEPDQAFVVDLDADYRPYPAELKEISFGRQAHHPTIRIPEFVIHSRKLDRFVAVKMSIGREIETYVPQFRPPVRPKKRTGDTSFALDSRVMLLSFMPSPDRIPIIADIYDRTLTSPDLMVEFITADEITDPGVMDQVRLHAELLNPSQGMCLVLMNPASDELPEVAEGIRPVAVGFDESKLQSAIESLV